MNVHVHVPNAMQVQQPVLYSIVFPKLYFVLCLSASVFTNKVYVSSKGAHLHRKFKNNMSRSQYTEFARIAKTSYFYHTWKILYLGISIHNISNFRFTNGPCEGSGNRNGTCYTSQECESKGGTDGGSCASGFGVCCISKYSSTLTTYGYIRVDCMSIIVIFSHSQLWRDVQWKLHLLWVWRKQTGRMRGWNMSMQWQHLSGCINICWGNDNKWNTT